MPERGDMNFQVTALNDLRAQFVQALEADVVVAPPQRAARPRIDWRRAWVAPAIALAVALIVIAITAIPWSSNPTVSEATAGVAKTALGASYPPDDWFTYSRSTELRQELSVTKDHTPILVGTERRAWLSVSRRGTIETKLLDRPSAPPIVTSYPAFGRYRIGDTTYDRAQIDAFAKDPRALLAKIDEEANATGHDQANATRWTIITEALRDLSPPLPATLRAALISELATVKNVEVVDANADPLGRAAVGLTFAEQDVSSTVYFDKLTSALSYSIVKVTKLDGHRGPQVKVGDTLERFELLESKATPTAPKL
jgi:hypothetical protein